MLAQSLLHFLSRPRRLRSGLSERAKGVAYTGINLEDLRLLPVAVPPDGGTTRSSAE